MNDRMKGSDLLWRCDPCLLYYTDLILMKHTCSSISKQAKSSEGVRLSNNHSIFTHISSILTSNFKNLGTSQWIPLCEQGVTVIYLLSEQPNSIAETLLRELTQLSEFEGAFIQVQ